MEDMAFGEILHRPPMLYDTVTIEHFSFERDFDLELVRLRHNVLHVALMS